MNENNTTKGVLLMDDAPHFVRALPRAFERAGFVVSTALNGRDGLPPFREGHC